MNGTRFLEIELPDETYSALRRAAKRAHMSEAELARELLQSSLKRDASLLGLFADEPELMDGVLDDAMQSREVTPLRLQEDSSG